VGCLEDDRDQAAGIAGHPLVRPNGTVVVPIDDAFESSVTYFTSTNGGTSWGATHFITSISDHTQAAGIRTPPLPSAEIDKRGRVFVARQDCRFRSGCSSDEIVCVIIKPSGAVSAVKRVPIDAKT